MAGFKMHITTSTVVGIGYGAVAYTLFDVPLPTCALAAGLCSVSGMMPDLDSEQGTPVREGSAFAAAVMPMLMMDRFQAMGWANETIALVAAGIYLAVRFTLPYLLGKFSVHRGMWHSYPAAAIAGLLAFMVCSGPTLEIRILKAAAVVVGFMSHLILDEIYSIDMSRGRIRFKKSFGTAMKFYSKSMWANLSTYGKLAALIALVIGEPTMMNQLDVNPPAVADPQAVVNPQTAERLPENFEHVFR